MKIENPTEFLREALRFMDRSTVECQMEAGRMLRELDSHLRDGGALPEQWRGPGTAVGGALEDAKSNVKLFRECSIGESRDVAEAMAAETEHWIAAVEGA